MNTLHLLPTLFFSLLFLPVLAYSLRKFPLPPVIGIDGKELKLGKSYYISSTLFPKPVRLCLVDNAKCPKDIIQCPTYYDDPTGLPVTFSSVNSSTEDTVVRESTPYRIEFSVAAGNCSDEKLWYIKDDGFANQEFVAIGPKTLAVEFIIQKASLGYKIIYCVLIPIPPFPICYGVGYIPEFGYNRLGIGKDVEPVQFFFANVTNNSTTAINKQATIATA